MTARSLCTSGLMVGMLVVSLVLPASGCRGERPARQSYISGPEGRPADYVAGIYDVLAIDSEFGIVRNQATQSVSLAEAIRAYVVSLDSVDFSACPEDFTAAFQDHRDAWQESIPFFERFPGLRGEMHDLFDQIRGRDVENRDELEQVEARIWDSWGEVEAVAADYGALEATAGD